MKTTKAILAAAMLAALASCTADRNSDVIRSFEDKAADSEYDQIKAQLSRSVDEPYAVPTLVLYGPTTIATTSAGMLALGRSDTVSDHTNAATLTLGGFSSGISTVASVTTSPKAIQVMRDLYANAIEGEPLKPADLKTLVNHPPTHRWFFYSASDRPEICGPDCVPLGKFGKHALWSDNRKDYSDFALAVLEASTLQLASVTTTVTKPATTTPANNVHGQPTVTQPAKSTTTTTTTITRQANPTILVIPGAKM